MSLHNRWLFLMATFTALAAGPLTGEQIRGVDVALGDRTAHALCTDGPVRVILLHGEDGSAESWRPVLQRLSGSVGACAYDRSTMGLGGHGRGWFELLDELRRVHAALGVQPGYALVGHSVGGLYARLFAADRPLDVGGLVLVDPTHEDMPHEVVPGMPETERLRWIARRSRPNADGIREADLDRRARASRLPDIPVTVITATTYRDGEGWDARFLRQAAWRVHASILRGIRSARHIPASGSGHEIHLEAPDMVAEEISRMVRMTAGPA